MLAKDMMITDVVCVDMDTRVPDVKKIMQENHIHHLPVLENNKLVGIISDRDLLRLISPFIGKINEQPRDLDTLNRAAHQIMTRQPITVSADTPVEKIIDWMLDMSLSSIPVVDKENYLLGIITWRDILHHAKFD